MPQRTKTALEILEGARRLLRPRYRWTKGKAVRLITEPDERPGYCYCVDGAVCRAAGAEIHRAEIDGVLQAYLDSPRSNFEALERAQTVLDSVARRRRQRAYSSVIAPVRVSYNDAEPTTHEDILSLVDEAIQIEREKESA